MINIICSSRYKIGRKEIKQSVEKLLAEKNVNPDLTLNIVFVGRNKMKDLTEKYKHEDAASPVLSFYYDKENTGEIILCYPQVVLLAAERNKRVDRIIEFLIEHGVENLMK